MQRKLHYSLVHVKGCYEGGDTDRKIVGFTIRTTDGADEAYSSKRAESKGSSMTEELIRFSLVSYDVQEGPDPSPTSSTGLIGIPSKSIVVTVSHPFESFDKWTTITRNYVVAAWKKLSTPQENDLTDFFASATDVA